MFVSGQATSYDTYCCTGKRGRELGKRVVMELEAMKALRQKSIHAKKMKGLIERGRPANVRSIFL